MANEKKWLEGENKFVEGKTTIGRFLETLAREIVTQNWVSYEKDPEDVAWAFDLRREIWLPSVFKEDNIRIYRATIEGGVYVKGEELIQGEGYTLISNIVRGIGDSSISGTGIGDKVLIEVNYEAEEFQRATFLEEKLPSGEVESVVRLKSRPQGKIEVFKDTISLIEGEQLHQMGGNEIYQCARTPISDSKALEHKLEVKVDGVAAVEGEDFLVDYFNGFVMFHEALEDTAIVTATYGVKTGLRSELVDSSQYKIYGDRIIDTTGGDLANLDVVVDADYYWELHYPEMIEDIATLEDQRIVLKTTVDVSTPKDWSLTKDYYWELEYYDKLEDEVEYKTGVRSRYGATLDELDNTTLDDKLSSPWGKWSWYRSLGFTEDNLIFDDWLPIRYWISFTQEHLNIVLQGDPSPDVHPYENYVISYAHLGMLKPYDNAKTEDLQDNFAYTISSDQHPMAEDEYSTEWGVRTGTGITDILMEKTGSNIPYQAHQVAFHTTPEFMDKHFIHVSEFTGSHHFSEVTVTHAYERERGKLQGMLIGDRSSIFHLDELVSNQDDHDYRGVLVGEDNNFKNECGLPVESLEKRWVMFNINAPYWFANNSPNVHYGVAIRKS